MDYFDTAKKYRNKRLKKIISILINILFFVIVAVIAWQVGVRDRNNIIAVHSSELIRIANEFKDLNKELGDLKLQSEADKMLIEKLNIELSKKPDNKLNDIIELKYPFLKERGFEKVHSLINSKGLELTKFSKYCEGIKLLY